jgi:Ca2+-transporting ATPase
MATFFLLSTGAADVLIILTALAVGWPLPLLPAQILWCNVVTNGIADVALAFEPGEKQLFRQPPRDPDAGVLNRLLMERLVIVGVWLAAGVLFMFQRTAGPQMDDLEVARTAALTTLVLFQKVHVFNCRSEHVSIFKKSLLANPLLLIGVLTSLGIHVAAMYIPVTQDLLRLTPLSGETWLTAIAVALTAILVNEAHKTLRAAPGGDRSR